MTAGRNMTVPHALLALLHTTKSHKKGGEISHQRELRHSNRTFCFVERMPFCIMVVPDLENMIRLTRYDQGKDIAHLMVIKQIPQSLQRPPNSSEDTKNASGKVSPGEHADGLY